MSGEIQDFTNTILISDEITHQIGTNDAIEFNTINALSDSFMKVYDLEKSKLPYHINILDLLWANENAHSRIFAELLKQNSGNRFDILTLFSKFLTTLNENFIHIPHKPEITSEKGRIDLLIVDSDFALIIENKIHGAIDQDSQLSKYIEYVKTIKHINESQIYVIYLTRDGNKIIDDKSWKTKNGNDYKNQFSTRFFTLSYKENILPWLKKEVLPNCEIKDVYLKSTVEQYIDYLEGMFNQRKINTKMNNELRGHISNVLNLNSTPENNYLVINRKIDELNKVKDQLEKLKQLTENDCWQEWAENLRHDFPNLQIVDKSDAKDFPKVGIKFKCNGKFFSVLLEKEIKIFFGICRENESDKIFADIQNIVQSKLKDGFQEGSLYYCWKHTSIENGYSRLKALIDEVIPIL